MKKLLISISLFLIIVAISFYFYQHTKNKTHQKENIIKIGAILPLTGNLAYFGEQEEPAMELAEINLNSNNNYKLNILFEDSKGQPKEAVNAINILQTQNVSFLISQLSSITNAIKPIAIKNGIPLITLAMDPTLPDATHNIIRIYESIEQESLALSFYFFNQNIDTARIFVVMINDVWGEKALQSFQIALNKYPFGEIVRVEKVSNQKKDFRDIAEKIKSSNANYVYFATYGPSVFKVLKAIKEQKLKVHNFGNLSSTWQYIINNSGSAIDNMIVAMPNIDTSNSNFLKFKNEFISKYNYEPEYEAAFSYDAILYINEIIKLAKEKNISFSDAVKGIKMFKGIVGNYHIKNGASYLNIVDINKIKQNKKELLKKIKVTDL